MPWDRKRDGTCPSSHNQAFLSSLALVNSYTSFKTLLCSAVIISPKPFIIPSPYTLSIFLLSQANLSICDHLSQVWFPSKVGTNFALSQTTALYTVGTQSMGI